MEKPHPPRFYTSSLTSPRKQSVAVSRKRVYISVGPLKAGLRRREMAMGFLVWIIVGLIGGWIFGLLGIWQGRGMIGSIIVAFIGAVILVWITRLIKRA